MMMTFAYLAIGGKNQGSNQAMSTQGSSLNVSIPSAADVIL